MMYVMSDVHGFYEPYMEAVNLLGSDDVLYVLGDVVDRGSGGIRILEDIMSRSSVKMLKGNHELMIESSMVELIPFKYSSYECERIIESDLAMGDNGQGLTLKAFAKLSLKKKMEIIQYIENLPLYASLTVQGREYIMAHASVPSECTSKEDIEFYADEDTLLWGDHEYCDRGDLICVVGHVPTRNIAGAEPDRIYHDKGNFDLDCGVCFGGKLGVLCLDTMEEYYF